MIYSIKFSKSANKELTKLPKNIQINIIKAIHALSNNPRSGNVRPMVGIDSWRLRVGNYRIIYDISDTELVVIIIKIAHRKNVYRKK